MFIKSWRIKLGVLFLLTALLVCGNSFAADKPKLKIVLSNALSNGPIEVMASWMLYAGSLTKDLEDKIDENTTEIKISYDMEMSARALLVRYWRDSKAKSQVSNKYLDQLLNVDDNSYLPEYVFHYLKQDDWVASPDLRLDEFNDWATRNLKGHKALTLAHVVLER